MEIKIYENLDKTQIESVKAFINDIKKYESTGLEFPFDDEDTFFTLVYDKGILTHCMALSHIQNEVYELICFTAYNKTYIDYIKPALKSIKSYLRKTLNIEAEILMLSDSTLGNEFAKALDFTLVNKELYLYFDYADFTDHDNKTYSYIEFDFNDYHTYHISDECRAYRNFLKFKIAKYSKDTAYLYDLYVKERYRNKKNAKKAFPYILKILYEKGIRKILLQVNASNKPALSLYLSFGFRVQQEISYYNIKD